MGCGSSAPNIVEPSPIAPDPPVVVAAVQQQRPPEEPQEEPKESEQQKPRPSHKSSTLESGATEMIDDPFEACCVKAEKNLATLDSAGRIGIINAIESPLQESIYLLHACLTGSGWKDDIPFILAGEK